MFGIERVELKTPDEVRLMREAGLVVVRALAAVQEAARPGVTTAELDAIAAAVITAAGATASFLGYQGFPASTCISVNDEVVHGIPGSRVLEPGDVVSIDCGAIVDGWHGDSAVTVVLDDADPEDVALSRATHDAMWAGIAALHDASRIGEVSAAIDEAITAAGEEHGLVYGIVEEYVGHGIGTEMHQTPDVPNFRSREKGARVRPGMCVAIEPMVCRGERFTQVCEDDWTVVTDDGARAAHWEHTVAVLEDGLWVLTAADGGAEMLAAAGVPLSAMSRG
ncbi:type I methionyl aminopeptidase [Sanguibacter sp. HDW7]|uniref:type I methionyl aminopeptidase n=1 Tax=Sanguibacter sp. HDW7 TaxID=2714931 RepID=UPI00140C41F1|nr:type I methionyl aminopeptidase [Sanguibacter sp. HDW7]QIK82751.1 type I methionyl aminopeptidase [Sanguibacter sp. HDW7]